MAKLLSTLLTRISDLRDDYLNGQPLPREQRRMGDYLVGSFKRRAGKSKRMSPPMDGGR